MAEIVEFSSKLRLRPPPRSPLRRFGAEEGTVLFLPCVRREPIAVDPAGHDGTAAGERKRIS